jgi:hypothetical protein
MPPMKKLFSFCLFFIVATTLQAQENKDLRSTSREARQKLVFGLKAGLNSSNVYDQSSNSYVAAPRIGGMAGAFLCVPVGRLLGFQPELHISQKGFIASGQMSVEPYTLTRTTTHLDIPLLLQLKPFSFLSLVAGPQYSYLMKQRDEFSSRGQYEEVSQTFRTDNIHKNLLGIVTGADINLWHLVVSVRTGWDVTANHGDGSSSTPRYKNFWLQGSIGYRIY